MTSSSWWQLLDLGLLPQRPHSSPPTRPHQRSCCLASEFVQNVVSSVVAEVPASPLRKGDRDRWGTPALGSCLGAQPGVLLAGGGVIDGIPPRGSGGGRACPIWSS